MSDNDSKRKLPARPSVEFLKNQAKQLLRKARRGDMSAIARLTQTGGTKGPTPRLADAQRAIAREHGHASWPRLLEAIRTESLDFAMQEVRFLARRYAASIGCSAHAIAALGRASSPTTLVEQLVPLCHRDAARSITTHEDPREQLRRLHDALQAMIEGRWDLDPIDPAPIDPATAPGRARRRRRTRARGSGRSAIPAAVDDDGDRPRPPLRRVPAGSVGVTATLHRGGRPRRVRPPGRRLDERRVPRARARNASTGLASETTTACGSAS